MITLEVARHIVGKNMPYDTGYMFTFGARYNETEHMIAIYYDTNAVPYIHWNEIGANGNPNKGFIANDTVNELNYVIQLDEFDLNTHLTGVQKKVQLRSTLIQQGVLEHASVHGEFGGGPYELYLG